MSMLCSTRGSVVLESSEFAPTDVEFVPNNSAFCVSICTSKTSKLRRGTQTETEFVPTAAAAPQLLRSEAVLLY